MILSRNEFRARVSRVTDYNNLYIYIYSRIFNNKQYNNNIRVVLVRRVSVVAKRTRVLWNSPAAAAIADAVWRARNKISCTLSRSAERRAIFTYFHNTQLYNNNIAGVMCDTNAAAKSLFFRLLLLRHLSSFGHCRDVSVHRRDSRGFPAGNAKTPVPGLDRGEKPRADTSDPFDSRQRFSRIILTRNDVKSPGLVLLS